MAKIYSYLKIALVVVLCSFINSCKKDQGVKISFHGTIIDGQTLQPVSNYPFTLNFIHASSGSALNLGSYSGIAKAVTNGNGEFTLTIHDTYTQDSADTYQIESGYIDTYFGVVKEISAKMAHEVENNFLSPIKVYKKIVVNFYVRHSGIANVNDFILIDISGIDNSGNDLFYGTDSLQQNSHEVVPNSPTIISWKGIRNNMNFGQVTDTVLFTNTNASYSITY